MPEYECSNGHYLSTPGPINNCLGMVDDEPCKGTLTQLDAPIRPRCEGVGTHAERLPKNPKKGRCEYCGKSVVLTREGKLRFHEKKR